jgi:hypothetical protein
MRGHDLQRLEDFGANRANLLTFTRIVLGLAIPDSCQQKYNSLAAKNDLLTP